MKHQSTRVLCAGLAAAGMVGLFGADLKGYVLNGHKWAGSQVTYYVNPQSMWVSSPAATSAVQTAASYWNQQSTANVQLVYGGSTSGSSLTMNYKNEVFFRNDSNGATIAEAYWWWDGSGNLVDADIVFHEGAYQFFAVSGCSNGYYIEDVGVHEFGHVLGLGHSDVLGATMYPYVPSTCDTTQESLEADDISGVRALYPPAATPAAPSSLSAVANPTTPASAINLTWADNASNETGYIVQRSTDGSTFTQVAQLGANTQAYTNANLVSTTTYYYRVQAINGNGVSGYSNTASAQTAFQVTTTNTAPTVTISTPSNNASYPANTSVSFSGSATDTLDGNMSANMVWTSSLDGQIGTGPSFSRTLSSGTHTITARVVDSGNLAGTAQITVSVTTVQGQTGPTLTARGYKVKSAQKVDLSWSGFASTSVDIYRNNTRITTTSGASYTDGINSKGAGTYTYKACAAGSATACSNTASVTF